MNAQNLPHDPTALAARWREDAQVFRRYGATGRARMLEQMAAELEQSTAAATGAVVDLGAAAAISGFTRSHLRRLIRDGKLAPANTSGGAQLFRVSDLPRKPGLTAADPTRTRREVVSELLSRHPPTLRKRT